MRFFNCSLFVIRSLFPVILSLFPVILRSEAIEGSYFCHPELDSGSFFCSVILSLSKDLVSKNRDKDCSSRFLLFFCFGFFACTANKISVRKSVTPVIKTNKMIFPLVESIIAESPNIVVRKYITIRTCDLESPISISRKCKCVSWSHFIGFCPRRIRAITT